jgi:hypothetical protein
MTTNTSSFRSGTSPNSDNKNWCFRCSTRPEACCSASWSSTERMSPNCTMEPARSKPYLQARSCSCRYNTILKG